MSENSYTVIDDQSSAVVYQGNWQSLQNVGFDTVGDTVTGTDFKGATATFNFTGVQVAVQCLALFKNPDDAATANFILDNTSPSPFKPPANANGTSVAFYISPELSSDPHTLVIEVTSASSDAPFIIDAFAVVPLDTPNGSSSAGTQTVVSTAFATPTNAYDKSSGSGHSTLVGPIVGGVVGGVALLLAAVLAFYFLFWRRRHSGKPFYFGAAEAGDMFESEAKSATPFNAYPPPPPASSTVLSDQSALLTTSVGSPVSAFSSPQSSGLVFARMADGRSVLVPASIGHPVSEYGSSTGGSSSTTNSTTLMLANAAPSDFAHLGSGSQQLTIGQRKALEAGVRTLPTADEIQQHADSGLRFNAAAGSSSTQTEPLQPADVPRDVPPIYSES